MPSVDTKSVDETFYKLNLADFLPEHIIDIHTHVWLGSFVSRGNESNSPKWPSRVASDNPVEDLILDYQRMLPGKKVTPCIFGYPDRNTNLDQNNRYTSEKTMEYHYPGLLVSKPEMQGNELVSLVEGYGFKGLKPYLCYAPDHILENNVTIYDFLPHHQLEIANKKKWTVVLHIPRSARLRDKINLHQLKEIDHDYPDIHLIVAHIGRAYCDSDVGEAFDILGETHLMFDFSANTNSNVMYLALKSVGAKRLVFGSDMPILRMRMRRICENGKYINLVPPGMYGKIDDDPHMREVSSEEGEKLTFFLYEELMAFKQAALKAGLSNQDLEDVFYNNAVNALGYS